ncbi:MAG: VWA domain-containing protein [Verrucomicrobiaceae bacterium]|nr:VWA domain-containing protein [Verrucomicrobiaceae bacterium]
MFEWEENVFLGIKALHRRLFVSPRERAASVVRVHLAPRRQQWFLLANMIAEKPVAVFETPNAVLCDHERVFLPPEFSIASTPEANEHLFQLKTILAALAIKTRVADPKALLDEIPALKSRIADLQPLLGETDFWQLIGRAEFSRANEPRHSKTLANVLEAAQQPENVTEIEGKGQTNVQVQLGDDDQPVEAEMPIHTFEKAETLEEYSGLDRKTDDEDELEEHAEALHKLDMKHVVRTRERPRSIYRSDIVMDGLSLDFGSDAPAGGIPYPEWDFKKQQHKPAWCHIQPRTQIEADAAWAQSTATKHRAVILDLRKKLAALATQTQRAKRQPHGPELDIDAVIAAQVAQHSGHAPDERLYIQRQRRLHDVAALVLMDQSFSTDSWVDDARVLDTIRETLFCVGEVMDEFIETFAVAGFSSNTRRQCDFHLIKDFRDPWRTSRARLGRLEANGYTRIGPALRHAQELLTRQSAEKKVIFLLTDGRPCDYDRYEGEYGIRDVRKAIETGTRHGIMTHAFAIEQRAREHFPRMFARQHYDIVPNPKALAASMCGAFARLRLAC